LKDALGDKFLPLLLSALREESLAQIDNLDKAEKVGWITSVDRWIKIREPGNQMVHEYIEDLEVLVYAVTEGHKFVEELASTAQGMLAEVDNRGLLEGSDIAFQ